MKKNIKTVAAFLAQEKAKDAVLNNLRKKVVSNTLTDEAKAEAEALIAEKEAEIQAIKDLVTQLEAEEDDKSAELKAKLAELAAKVVEVENSLKTPKGFVQVQNFVESKEGMKAFLKTVQNSVTGSDFKENWKGVLVKNGLSNVDFFLPPAVLAEINDNWEKTADNFLSLLDVTGLVSLRVATETGGVRAEGHAKGTAKTEQVLTFAPKEIRAQIVFKYITIDRETVEFEDNTGALVQYIARELSLRILHEIMRAVLIGDGRAPASVGKISRIEAITDASTIYRSLTTYPVGAANFTLERVANAIDTIHADGDIVVFMSKRSARALRRYIAATGGTARYISLEELAAELGVAKVITTKVLTDFDSTTVGANVVVAFVGKAYKIVGDLTMKGFENFVLGFNQNEYLTEVYIGGGLAVPESGAVVRISAT